MKIIVLVKYALITDLRHRIRQDAKGFEEKELICEMNNWDTYALEEAVQIKEKVGAEVVAISVGTNCDDTLRKCLAVGVDRVIKISFESLDSRQISEAISNVIKVEKFDLILAGFQSQDLNSGFVGQIIASKLDLPYATAVDSIILEEKGVRIIRELEGGLKEEDILPLPCVLTVQTGINKPRYPSMRGIIKAKSMALETIELSEMLKPPSFEIKKIYYPSAKKGKILEGQPVDISINLIAVLQERGLL